LFKATWKPDFPGVIFLLDFPDHFSCNPAHPTAMLELNLAASYMSLLIVTFYQYRPQELFFQTLNGDTGIDGARKNEAPLLE
jgi:hypothetical protein